MMKRVFALVFVLALAACSGGYSFTGGDVGNAKTISIQFFPNYADLVKPQFSQIFTEKLRDIFVQQTPLELVERNGDLQFEGSIISYTIEPLNAQAGNEANVAQNRLSVTVNAIYTNGLEPDKSFEKKFTRFVDFDANADINSVEATLHEQVSQELAENILNQSIGNW
jgi:hypothetical protein